MLETIRDVHAARKWYQSHGEGQYQAGSLDTYDHAAQLLTQREAFADALLQHIGDEPGRTLEMAAGTGLISLRLSKSIPGAIYTEFEGQAVNTLNERLGNETVAQADFYRQPFADKSFDTVITVGGYRYVEPERRNEFWSELDRITQPDGRVFIAQFYPRGSQIQGNDIGKDLPNIGSQFTLENIKTFDAKIPVLGKMKVRSGTYRSYAFRHTG
jgi:ubiquinone/menaquinone biosynthesis C-methylase UbiE